ncbi:AlpA family phage regulatory protein [Rhodoglobus sp. NPDC076762]
MEDEFIRPATVVEITGMSIAALAQMRTRGRGPRFYKPTERTVLYKRSEIMAWLESSAQSCTAPRVVA